MNVTQQLVFPDKETAESALELAGLRVDGEYVTDHPTMPLVVHGTVRQQRPDLPLVDGEVQFDELPGYRAMIRMVSGVLLPEALWPYEIDTPAGPYPDFQ